MRLQEASQMSLALYGLPLVVAISGGKDSSICIELARRAGIPFEVMHNHTTADAPETVYFLRDDFKKSKHKESNVHETTRFTGESRLLCGT